MMKNLLTFASVAKKTTQLLSTMARLRLLLVMLLTLCVSAAWGADATVKWTASSGALGSGIGSGTIKTGTFSWSYNRTLISGTSYTGWQSSCVQLGKNGGVENITFSTSSIPGTIKSVSVECSSYQGKHKVAITVGGNSYLASTATFSWTTVSAKTGNGTKSGEIVISFTEGTCALYIKSISVTYEEAATCTTNPTVSAGSNSNVTSTTATVSCTGGITSLGSAGCSITSYGFVYGTTTNPTTSNTKVQVGTTYTTTGTAFSKELTGLTANTTYYVRPYATNGNGTAYGTQTSFKTLELPKYTVTLNAGPGTCAASVTEASAGAGVTLPTPTLNGCDEWSFAGWATFSVANETSSKPATLLTGSYKPTANTTLYAVYQRTEDGGGSSEYSKLNWGSNIKAGKYLISTGIYTVTGKNGNKTSELAVVNYTPSTEQKTNYEFTISEPDNDGYFTIKLPDNSCWVGWSTSTSTALSETEPSDDQYLWKYSSNGIQNKEATTRYLQVNGTCTAAKVYTTDSPGTNWKHTYLYSFSSGSTIYYHSTPDCVTETVICAYHNIR